jgi:hypothetical protein
MLVYRLHQSRHMLGRGVLADLMVLTPIQYCPQDGQFSASVDHQ